MIHLDGSQGEGGGQILRSSLALSLITGQPFRMIQIRANRPKPGLQAQHLASVLAAAEVGQATLIGASLNSSTLEFRPGAIRPGTYEFRISTAGSTALVLHTVALPLLWRQSAGSSLVLHGGTHVDFAPSFLFLQSTWCEHLRHLGLDVRLELVRAGFYPRGGGTVRATLTPNTTWPGVNVPAASESRPNSGRIRGIAGVADVDAGIAERIIKRITARMTAEGHTITFERQQLANGPGVWVGLAWEPEAAIGHTAVPAWFVHLGKRGVPAEQIADAAMDELRAHRNGGGTIDPYSADQLMLLAALASAPSAYHVSEITQHTLTNRDTIQQFVDARIRIHGEEGQPGWIEVQPACL
ncbi:RNA 3'-terminal phosphate cyclase [Tuwongella immobilis]|uniref:RNA 3'-terminal phosphate cyclase n=1 Tax=Tuwongella immobilis TaxID=692036 RepID=A0A6C2YLJ2_9BACT|nr:RNA 3'-terminal phosphate cyclase [Tuwongella immobilis]VIP01993.1 rna 3 -phosphate cyclase : RNA 3''-phosphate cyclase OS=Singulisphaera acidiphila (strain ATCC BAA-1392 / DSM 18658 / VKM B-2454 / MOB10) GN=Sinac_0456 PE=4 SV=1: RTC: RTC_insert [Tuwongella immobilis]VTS00066.1 rna 3 -phosphate cyclase : RNA 3''-phosphate cyclase OS=Singulisphaera acidiphila (strain ATCC BAA-1392 / DSM 18658 / VKM B-2454 / MOB10) GN=Sinac_0456 PE=4 SV=1: RTC: RTC_insert [Tuwongella immobilis]